MMLNLQIFLTKAMTHESIQEQDFVTLMFDIWPHTQRSKLKENFTTRGCTPPPLIMDSVQICENLTSLTKISCRHAFFTHI